MTDKLRQFERESGLEIYGLGARRDKWEYAMQQFSKLIVEECARVAAATPCPYTDETMRTQLGHTWDMACVASARDIRQHFKVKE